LDITAGGIETKISGIAIEKIFGKSKGKDDRTREELQNLANVLLPKIANSVRASAGGKDAKAVAQLLAQEKADLANEAGDLAVEILKAINENKEDRQTVNALLVITAGGAVAKLGLGIGRAAVSHGADVLAWVQIAKALKTIVAGVKEHNESVDKRAKALNKALENIKPATAAEKMKKLTDLKDNVQKGDWDKSVSGLQEAVAKLAGGLPAAKKARTMHGSKTAVLYKSWQDSMSGMNKLLVAIRNAPPAEKKKLADAETKVETVITEAASIGELFEIHLDLQISARAKIDAASAIQKKVADASAALTWANESKDFVVQVYQQVKALVDHSSPEVTWADLPAKATTTLDDVTGVLEHVISLGLA
jgi:hypothetical protein